MIRLFEMRAEGTYTDQQIADELNRLGFQSRIQYIRDRHDKSKIIRQIGGRQMTAKMVDRYSHNLIYAGLIKEKWTNDEPVKARFAGLVPLALFNKASRGKLFIEIDEQNNVTVRRQRPPEYLATKNMHNPEYPYKKVVACPQCGGMLCGSASRGKKGKYYPAYHCTKKGHYFRVPKAAFEQTIEDIVKRLQISPDRLDELMAAIETSWNNKQAQAIADEKQLGERHREFQAQIKATIDRMKVVTSETVIKHLEGEVVDIEKQMQALDIKPQKPAETVDIQVVLQYARYLAEHLSDILLRIRNPLRKAAFFGAIFNQVPSYEILAGGTQNNSAIPGVNELFRIGCFENPNMVTPAGVEPAIFRMRT